MRVKLVLAIIFLLSEIQSANAWQPCMPFCDASCGGAATLNWGMTVTGEYLNQASTNAQHLGAITQTSVAMSNMAAQLAASNTTNTAQLNIAIDNMTKKNSALLESFKEIRVRTADHITSTLTGALRQLVVAKATLENLQTFGPSAQTSTGDVMACSANHKTILGEKAKRLILSANDIRSDYSSESTPGDQGVVTEIANQLMDRTDIKSIFEKDTLSDKEAEDLHTFVLLTSQSEQLDLTLSENDSLDTRVYHAKLEWLQHLMSMPIIARTGLTSLDWVGRFVSRTCDEPVISKIEALSASVNGRLSSNHWFLEMKTKSKVGLLRELVYLQAEENEIIHNRFLIREARNQALALLVLENSTTNRPTVPST